MRIVGIASDGLAAVLKAEELQPDVILLDVGLPKINGIEAARRIRKVAPKSKILFLSQEIDSNAIVPPSGEKTGTELLASCPVIRVKAVVLRPSEFVTQTSPVSLAFWWHPFHSRSRKTRRRSGCHPARK
jgi:CheY-like chemotaxis protein